jgi:hypothetical protein
VVAIVGSLNLKDFLSNPPDVNVLVVKVFTEYYTRGGTHVRAKTLRVLKRRSKGFDFFTEDVYSGGAREALGALSEGTENGDVVQGVDVQPFAQAGRPIPTAQPHSNRS